MWPGRRVRNLRVSFTASGAVGPRNAEFRRPLGRERRPPFDEVGAEGRSLGQRAKSRRLLGHTGGDGVDRALAASDRDLAQVGQAARIAEHGLLQRRLDPPVDKADRQRLVGFDPPAR